MLLEVCVSSLAAVRIAQRAGAHRLELCQDLSVGGLTPTTSLVEEVLVETALPVFVLVRPRQGNFVYSKTEKQTMLSSIARFLKLGIAGFISGGLTTQFEIDYTFTEALLRASKGLPFTFHRAFDEVHNPLVAIKELQKRGVSRILTAGGKGKAIENLQTLMAWRESASESIIILPGGGIRGTDAVDFYSNNFKEIHTSAITEMPLSRTSLPNELELRKILESMPS